MEETASRNLSGSTEKEIKFPIAVIFAIIVTICQIVNILGYWQYFYVNGSTWVMFLPILSSILLIVALFVRKSRKLLVTALSISVFLGIWEIFQGVALNGGLLSILVFLAANLCGVAVTALLIVFAVVSFGKETRGAKICEKLWYIPGILSIFYMLASLVGKHNIFQILITVFLVPMDFLLGRWLTHPYKKPQRQYYATVQNTYDANGEYQCSFNGTAPAQMMQKECCAGCGKELLPDEQFCAACGRKRPESVPRFAYQQPANPQDIPSSGMNALSFFFPGVGLILYLVWKDQTPIKARKIGKFALIGFCVWMGLSILLTILAYVIQMLILFG